MYKTFLFILYFYFEPYIIAINNAIINTKYYYYKYCSIDINIPNYNIISNNIDLKWVYKYDCPQVENILKVCNFGEKFIINDVFIEVRKDMILVNNSLTQSIHTLELDDYLDIKFLRKLII